MILDRLSGKIGRLGLGVLDLGVQAVIFSAWAVEQGLQLFSRDRDIEIILTPDFRITTRERKKEAIHSG